MNEKFSTDLAAQDVVFPSGFSESDHRFGSGLKDAVLIHGKDGASAYEVAVKNGFDGTAEEWLASLKGASPEKGVDYYTEEEKQLLVSDVYERFKADVKPAKIGYATLLASSWVGADSLYAQVVSIEGVTEYSQVDLTPSVQQLAIFYEKDLTFVTENEDGVVTVYAIGQKPTNDYTIQVTITEVGV